MNKKILIIITLLFALLGGLFFIISSLRNITNTPPVTQNGFPTPTIYQVPDKGALIIQAQNISPLKKTHIGITTEEELKSIPNISQNGNTYSYPSPLILRPNEVIVENGVVVFEKVLIPEDQEGPYFKTVTSLKNAIGDPDGIIKGSAYYDWYAQTLIYSQLGLAAITNPYTDEVFEIHFFEPTSVENYISRFGGDIQESPSGQGPIHP